jgi:hypothetical protein
MTPLSALRNNLIEMASVQCEANSLVTSFSGKTLYASKSFMGLFFRIFTSKEKRIAKVEHAVQETVEKFWNVMGNLSESRDTYLAEMRKKLRKETYDLRGMEQAQKVLLKAALHFKPLFKCVEQQRPNPLLQYLLTGREEEQARNFTGLSGFIRFVQRSKDFELATKTEIPLTQLKKLYDIKALKAKEEDKIKAWMEKVCGVNVAPTRSLRKQRLFKQCTNRALHRYLYQLTQNLFMVRDRQHFERLGNLENKLVEWGFDVFTGEDEAHLNWRNGLKEGSVLLNGGREIVLGEELAPPLYEEEGQSRVFAIQGDPAWEIVIYRSESEAFRLNHYLADLHSGIPMAAISSPINFGEWLYRERLRQPITAFKWSRKGVKGSDKEKMQTIIELIKSLISHKYTPLPFDRPFDASFFQFNAQGEMRVTYPMVQDGRHYDIFEEMIVECSRGNMQVHDYLLRESGLKNTKRFKSYQTIVKAVLKGGDLDKIANDNGKIRLPELIQRRRDLCNKILEIRDTVQSEILENYTTRMKLGKPLIKFIQKRYELEGWGFRLPDKFKESIKNSFLATHMKKFKLKYPGSRGKTAKKVKSKV